MNDAKIVKKIIDLIHVFTSLIFNFHFLNFPFSVFNFQFSKQGMKLFDKKFSCELL